MTIKVMTIFISEDEETSKKIVNDFLAKGKVTYANVLSLEKREEIIKKIEEVEEK